MELPDVSNKMSPIKAIVGTVADFYKTYKLQRLERFFACIELRYEYMNEIDTAEFKASLESKDGRNILGNFVDSVLSTSSPTVAMAVALLYCRDRDFIFSQVDVNIFIHGVTGLTEHLVDFYIAVASLSSVRNDLSYDLKRLSIDKISDLQIADLDSELAYSYVNDLISRGLLLPRPESPWVLTSGEIDKDIEFGTSTRTMRMVKLLAKAKELYRSPNPI